MLLAFRQKSIIQCAESMRVTIAIEADDLSEIQRVTRQKDGSSAIRQALAEFLHEAQKKQFLKRVLSGRTDYTLTNEEMEACEAIGDSRIVHSWQDSLPLPERDLQVASVCRRPTGLDFPKPLRRSHR
jgi:hypothetical protein